MFSSSGIYILASSIAEWYFGAFGFHLVFSTDGNSTKEMGITGTSFFFFFSEVAVPDLRVTVTFHNHCEP